MVKPIAAGLIIAVNDSSRLGEDAFVSAYATGRGMLIDEMCIEALNPLRAAATS